MHDRHLRHSGAVCGVLALLVGGAACTKTEQPAPPAPSPPPEETAAEEVSDFPPLPPPPPSAEQRPAAAAAEPAKKATPIDTLNGHPNGLKRDDLDQALQRAMPSLAACIQTGQGPPNVGLSFDVDATGRPQNVQTTGTTLAQKACLSAALVGARIPAFEGNPVPVQFPLSVYRPEPPPAPPPPPTEAMAPPPPTTVEPSSGSTAPYAPAAVPTEPAPEGKVFIQP